MSLINVVIWSGVTVAILSLLALWSMAVYTLAVSFKHRWNNRFTDAPAPEWLRVFPRFAFRKVHRRQLIRLTVIIGIVGFVVGMVLGLAFIGALEAFA